MKTAENESAAHRRNIWHERLNGGVMKKLWLFGGGFNII